MDPLIPLAISIADGPGTYAFLLGSGVSRGAGVPTGQEILSDSIRELYRLLHNREQVTTEEVQQWFESSKYKNYTFSRILEELRPGLEECRRFLERYFLGKEPSKAHQTLARMVKGGFVKVIVTTNFDDLMEKALDEESIPYDVVSTEGDLEDVRPREHSPCRILKLHGDWRKLNIKVTSAELERLEPSLEREFQEIVNRYGIVVMGYSGLDQDVMNCLRERRSIYRLYWLVRGDIDPDVKRVIEQQEGKLVSRDSADDFMRELELKVRIFLNQPDADTPELLSAQVIELLRDKDEIGVGELIRRQNKVVIKQGQKPLEESRGVHDADKIYKLLEYMEDIADRLIAIGLPLIENDKNELFAKLLRKVQSIFQIRPSAGSTAVLDIPFALVHNMLYLWGSWALHEHNMEALRLLLSLRLTPENEAEPQIAWQVFKIHYSKIFERDCLKAFQHLVERYSRAPFLLEFFDSEADFRSSLAKFNFLLTLLGVKNRIRISPMSAGESSYSAILGFLHELFLNSELLKAIASTIFEEAEETFQRELLNRMEIAGELIPFEWAGWQTCWSDLLDEAQGLVDGI